MCLHFSVVIAEGDGHHRMDKDWIIRAVSEHVYRKFPEFAGVKPSFKWSPHAQGNPMSCTLTFQTTVQTANGKKMPRRVKVTADAEGKILKVTSSK